MTDLPQSAKNAPHQLHLDGRTSLHLTGIVEVESFDPNTIILLSTCGTLIVRGENLHLQLLRLDGGEVLVDGTIDAMSYEASAAGAGFWARLFG